MENEKPNYFAIIPADVRYDNELRANEKLLYGEITALTKKTGECWANNKYFSELYGVKENAIATWIRHLKNKKYIDISYVYEGKVIKKRIIKIGGIQKDSTPPIQKDSRGGIQKGEDNNTRYINNTSIKENNKRKDFKKPTIDEIETYCRGVRNNNIDAKYFFDFYEAGDWIDSKGNEVKNWKQKVISWERRNKVVETKNKEQLPEWWDKEFKEERSDEERAKIEAIRNGTYRA